MTDHDWEPVMKKASGIVKKIGKRTIRLVTDAKELKALKKVQKAEPNPYD
jgi:phosphoenolpyruvate synthase/pyruvate phosphate dikinase